MEGSEVPESDSSKSTLRLIATPPIKGITLNIDGDHGESFYDSIDLFHGRSHSLAVLMASRVRHGVWGDGSTCFKFRVGRS